MARSPETSDHMSNKQRITQAQKSKISLNDYGLSVHSR